MDDSLASPAEMEPSHEVLVEPSELLPRSFVRSHGLEYIISQVGAHLKRDLRFWGNQVQMLSLKVVTTHPAEWIHSSECTKGMIAQGQVDQGVPPQRD